MNSDKKEFVISAEESALTNENRTVVPFESAGEFVLPDYMPKVQKVLRVEARVVPPSRYVGASSAEMSGSVLHTLIYVGEDGEVAATVLPSKYEFSVPISESISVPSVFSNVAVESVTYRPSAPRKINIRTRLSAQNSVITSENIAMTGEKNDLHTLDFLMDSVKTSVLRSDEITLSENLDIGKGDSKLLWCGANAAVNDIRVTDGGVNVRGDVVLKILIEEEGKPKMISKKIPFDEFVDGDAEKGSYATATASIVSTEAAKGSDAEVMADVIMTIEVVLDTPCKISAVKDVFSDTHNIEPRYINLPTKRHLLSRSGVFNTGSTISRATFGDDGAIEILDSSGSVKIDDAVASGGKMTVSGRCMMNSFYLAEDGTVASTEYTVPFSITLPCEGDDNVTSAITASLMGARVRMEGDSVICDMDIAISARVFEEGETEAISKCEILDLAKKEIADTALCLIYPCGDSLWTLAKKYKVSPEKLAKVNSINIEGEKMADPGAISSLKVMMLEL